MTILSVLQAVRNELGLDPVTQVVGSSEAQIRQLLSFVYAEIEQLRREFDWPTLVRTYTFSTVNGQVAYPFPNDFLRPVSGTEISNNNRFFLDGPISPREWQWRVARVGTGPQQVFRYRGRAGNSFLIDPPPGTSSNNISYEYISRTAISPKLWTANSSYPTGTWVSNDSGNYYKATTGGTSGAGLGPTGTGGTIVDGGVTWAYQNTPYTTFLADTDFCLIDETILVMGVKVRFSAEKVLENAGYHAQMYRKALDQLKGQIQGAPILNLGNRRRSHLLSSYWNAPSGNWGS